MVTHVAEPTVALRRSTVMPRKLKVYRTPTGFHDAYVAAPSQKAALAAWGSDANLFARGIAEEVTDAALTKRPLAHPGEVFRVTRGSTADHMAALPRTERKARPPTTPEREKRKPRPSKTALTAAETALAEAEADFADQDAALAKEEAALATRRKRLDRDRTARIGRLTTLRDAAKDDYAQALAAWEP